MQTTGTQGVTPEIVAAISAAVQMMCGEKYIAVHIERISLWKVAGLLAKCR